MQQVKQNWKRTQKIKFYKFQNKNTVLKIISKVEGKIWPAATIADWQLSYRQDTDCPGSASPLAGASYLWAVEWAIHVTPWPGQIFNQILFYMVKPKLKIKWKPVKQRAWAVTLN